MKNSSDTIGNRTRELPACSAALPQLFSCTHPYKRVVTFKAAHPTPQPSQFFTRIFLSFRHCSVFCWAVSFATSPTILSVNVATFGTISHVVWIETKSLFYVCSAIFHLNLSIGPDWRNLTDAIPSRAEIGLLPPTVKWTIFCNG
jgi:hypothetical protein